MKLILTISLELYSNILILSKCWSQLEFEIFVDFHYWSFWLKFSSVFLLRNTDFYLLLLPFLFSFLFYHFFSLLLLPFLSHSNLSFHFLFSFLLFCSLLFSSIILISNLFNKWHLSFISSNEIYFILFYFSISSPSIHLLSSSFSPYQLILFLVRCSLFFIFNISNLGIFWSLT